MNKRERIFHLLEGKPVDRPPVGFWLHFPAECAHGDAAVKAHLDFIRETDTDIMKVMNENLLYDGETKINCLADIPKFRAYTRKDKIYQDQMEIIRRVTDAVKAEVPVLATIHGLIASAFHETGYGGFYTSKGYGLTLFCRERPQEMKAVFQKIAESLMELVDCSLEAGADGIFYAALGGERHFFSDEEFAEFVAPYEKQIYDYIKSKTDFNVLHICKSNIGLDRYRDLEPRIVNWGIYDNSISLTEGRETYFPNSILLGGYDDRTGVLAEGSDAGIEAHAKEILQEMEGYPFIVGSDCTLPTEIPYEKIRKVVEAVEKYGKPLYGGENR